MNKTQTKIDAERYEAPKMKVKELRCRRVLCASQLSSMGFNGTEQTDDSDGDFE